MRCGKKTLGQKKIDHQTGLLFSFSWLTIILCKWKNQVWVQMRYNMTHKKVDMACSCDGKVRHFYRGKHAQIELGFESWATRYTHHTKKQPNTACFLKALSLQAGGPEVIQGKGEQLTKLFLCFPPPLWQQIFLSHWDGKKQGRLAARAAWSRAIGQPMNGKFFFLADMTSGP